MTFKKASLPAGIVLFMLCQAAASAATLKSADNGFLLNIPGKWQAEAAADPGSVLQVKKGRAEIKIRALSAFSAEKALKAKLQASQKKLKKGGVAVPNKIFTASTEDGGEIIFLQFVSKGKRYRSGYFNLAGRSYGFLLTNLSNSEFEGLYNSLVPLQGKEKPSAEARKEPAAPVPAPAPAASALPAPPANMPPAASTDTLGAPPAGAAFAAGGARPESPDLPPLPKRDVGGALWLFLIAAALSAAALGYRALARKAPEVPEANPVPGSLFPFRVERRYFSFPIIFDVKDAAGQQYKAVSYRVPALVLGTGVVLYFLLKALVQLLVFTGVDIKSVPESAVMAIVGLLSLANILIFGGVVLSVLFPQKLKVYDPSGGLIFDVRRKRLNFGSLYFLIRDAAGNGLGKMRRVGFVFIRRRWQLLDAEDKVLLDIQEDSAAKAIARKLCGHLWGLLRTNYRISDGNTEIGELKRDFSIWNRYSVAVQGLSSGPDPRLVMATSLFIDVIDPDRWHPWHG
ncbi:MAG: hypothetical protein WCK76_10140 [Elusimicrobiota bacterium]